MYVGCELEILSRNISVYLGFFFVCRDFVRADPSRPMTGRGMWWIGMVQDGKTYHMGQKRWMWAKRTGLEAVEYIYPISSTGTTFRNQITTRYNLIPGIDYILVN